MTLLEVTDVTRRFGGVTAVDRCSLSIHKGSLTGLIGPNGAGKSTLLAMLAGTLPVSSGRIIYQGQDVTRLPAYRRARLGLVRTFQLASEFKRLTVMENLHRKGWLRRDRDGRAWRYEPTGSRSGYTAALMSNALDTSADRRTALAHFVLQMSPHDAELLQPALDQAHRRPGEGGTQ